MPLEKAMVTNTITGVPIPVMFNPEEYTVNQDVNYAQTAVPGLSAPLLQFVHGNMQTLEMELFLDTYEAHQQNGRTLNQAGDDVRKLSQQIVGLMDIDATTHAPPVLLFTWASLSFTCVLARVSQRFTMFLPDGTPVRARLQATFNEFRNIDLEAKEVKRETANFSKIYVVNDGESLRSIAWKTFGDATMWRPIALRNGIDNPRLLPAGTMLIVPQLPYRDPQSGEVFSVAVANLRFAPEFRVVINDSAVPAALRASISSVSCQSGLEGADRVELTLANEGLRWLDNPLFALDNKLALFLGYAPDPLDQLFVGKIVGQEASFPSGGMPTLTVVAQDRRKDLQSGNKVRWFAVPVPSFGNFPIPDLAVASLVTIENALIPVFDPIGATLSILLGGVDLLVNLRDPDSRQRLIRKQQGESDFDFLSRIARENGWEILIDHSGSKGGYKLRFMSPEGNLTSDITLKYGQSLIDFRPRISNVGQIAGVSVSVWQPDIKTDFTVSASWDWDRQALDLSISPGVGLPGSAAKGSADPPSSSSISDTETLVEEPANLATAARVILSKLIPQLNRRLTGSGSTVGDTRIRAGTVLRLEAVGQSLGGLYRVTSATHALDSNGYRTNFEVRKEIWFGSIPLPEQGANRINVQV